MDNNFKLIHDEFHRCIELVSNLKEYNKNLEKTIRDILEQHESRCLDTEEDREILLDHLTEKLNIGTLDKILTDPSQLEEAKAKYVELFGPVIYIKS